MGAGCSTINAQRPGDIQYNIAITTGDSPRAGTDADVQLTLIGSNGTLKTPVLDKWFHDDFERGQTDSYRLWGINVGDIWLAKLHVSERGFYPDWYVDQIVVTKNYKTPMTETYIMPVWEWVSDGNWLSTGHGKVIYNMPGNIDNPKNNRMFNPADTNNPALPQAASKIQKLEYKAREQQREDEMYSRQVIYNWRLKPTRDDPDDRMPGHVDIEDPDKLPPNLKWEFWKDQVFKNLTYCGTVELNLRKYIQNKNPKNNSWSTKNFGAYKELSDLFIIQNLRKRKMKSSTYKNWFSDYEFGRQFYDGCFHRALWQVKSVKWLNQKSPFINIPLKIKNIDVRLAIEENRCYLCDYRELRGLKTMSSFDTTYNFEFAPASCLFVNAQINESVCVDKETGQTKEVSNWKLIPLAIALWPDTNFIIYADDKDQNLWLLAKIYLKNAALLKNICVDHCFYSHMLIEPFSFSLFRQFNHSHPIYKMLLPHLQFVSQINTFLRSELLSPREGDLARCLSIGSGGHLNLIRKNFDNFQLKELDPNFWLHRQGLLDKKGLPNHSYRDDALLLWTTINTLVKKIINIFYQDDDEVRSDTECQNWFADSRNKGFDFDNDDDYEDDLAMFDGLDQLASGKGATSKGASPFSTRNASPLSIIHEDIEKTAENLTEEDRQKFNRNFCIPEKLNTKEELIWLFEWVGLKFVTIYILIFIHLQF